MPIQRGDISKRLAEMDEQERKIAIERSLTLDDALKSRDVNTIYKAQKYYSDFLQRNNPNLRQESGVKAMIMDPMEVSSSMGYFHKSTIISNQALRQMSRAPIIRAIINTRKDQFAEFLKPQPDKYSKGFVIEKVDQDKDAEVSERDKRIIKSLTKFLVDGGDVENKWKWDDLETVGRKWIEDSLVLDQACIEIVPRRNFEPYSFVAVDGATMRIASSWDDMTDIEGKLKVRGCYPSYVQLYQGQIIREFYPWELAFCVRNPSTNILANGYGRSELEDLVATVTAMLNADSYNAGFFRQGSAPKGMLMVKNAQGLNGDRLKELQRNWNAMVSGAQNAHKTPVLDADSIEWVDMHKNNRDMEFSKFQEWLLKLACAIFKISPEEIGFTLEGSKPTIGGNGNGDKEKKYSVDKGLKPLLTFFQKIVNKYLIGPKTNDQFVFKFVGIEVESIQEEEERLIKAATTYLTPNEIRKDKGLKPLKSSAADLPLNPIFLQQQQMEMQSKMDQQQQQKESDDEQFANENPFLGDDQQEENPIQKSFESWFIKEFSDHEELVTA